MLLVIGDSHSVIWGGKLVLSDKDHRSLFPDVAVHYLGAPLAYNLIADTVGAVAPGKWGMEVLKRVKEAEGATALCLCFGEIDVRTRAVKTALEEGIPLKDSVERIAARLVAFCEILKEHFAQPIFVAAPVPCASQGRGGTPSFPSYGSERELNWATRLFADYLSAKSLELGAFHVISIVDRLLDSRFQTRRDFYADEVHLNARGFDLLVEEFHRVVRETSLPLADFWDPGSMLGDATIRDVSNEIAVQLDAQDQTNTVLIDIGFGAFPHRLRLTDLKFDCPRLEISLSGGLLANNLMPIGRYAVVPSGEERLDFAVEFPKNYSCRYLQLGIEASAKVSLNEVRLDVRSFLRPER